MTLRLTKPSHFLTLDAAGALLSAVSLGLIAPLWADALGTTPQTLRQLAGLPLVYLLIDLAALWRAWLPHRVALALVGSGNALYPLLASQLLQEDAVALTPLGWGYFGLECCVVWVLAVFELRAAARPAATA